MGALVSSIVANVNRGKGRKPVGVDEFMIIQSGLKNTEEVAEAANDDQREAAHLKATMALLQGIKRRPR